MTKSEKLCNEQIEKLFFKDFTYTNLYYAGHDNNRKELCDALVEFPGYYIPIQIKERSVTINNGEDEEWLNKTVFTNAVEQMRVTIDVIYSEGIVVKDKYQQCVVIDKNKDVLPIILFDNNLITEYQRIVRIKGGYAVNVFNMMDFTSLMEQAIISYDVVDYLLDRLEKLYINENFSGVEIVDDDDKLEIGINRNESERIEKYLEKQYCYDESLKNAAKDLNKIIEIFRQRRIKKDKEYKIILEILLHVSASRKTFFMDKFIDAMNNARRGVTKYNSVLKSSKGEQDLLINFVSLENESYNNEDFFKGIYNKVLHEKGERNVLMITFLDCSKGVCVNWRYYK